MTSKLGFKAPDDNVEQEEDQGEEQINRPANNAFQGHLRQMVNPKETLTCVILCSTCTTPAYTVAYADTHHAMPC
jgi:hypothetical protein